MYDAESKGAIQYIQLAEEVLLKNENYKSITFLELRRNFVCSHD